MKYQVVKGDLIQLALQGEFDVIAHGCNCFCTQNAGIAAQMSKVFKSDNKGYFIKESYLEKGNINKLGQIEYNCFLLKSECLVSLTGELFDGPKVIVTNTYTQYQPGRNLDYEAFTLCMRKINYQFKGKHIGLPWIGCGIAGGDKTRVEQILRQELKDCNVTVCEL